MLTTYRHDYVAPFATKQRTLEHQASLTESKPDPDKCEKLCSCEKEAEKNKKQSTKTNLKTEWTGIAPMGLLVQPRIISNIPQEDVIQQKSLQGPDKKCTMDQPNRFLKVLRTCYPDLYERLANIPDNELQRRIDIERLKSTYQVDYCHIPEYPEGVYNSLDQKDGKDASKKSQLSDGCNEISPEEFKIDEECIKTYKPPKVVFNSGPNDARPKDKPSQQMNQAIKKEKPKISEYVDKISRLGCVIQKANMHDHRKCKKVSNMCRHILKKCDEF